ncbi:hypothetical protein D187_000120 [Cystobacter fuscus DSM 2262]|uniref:Uncharacterized protein n=1 Tax=Cystobacter fuscus (strain ATCC 25194 / DSM 2262 / NBRC 100088 / M29) TaxID=1242864 RepID=S9R6R2_CYSF2|nr:hypothetical protein [Cystobacter fuscus]EPX64698.1 hypothetical protein D187_000120 [Cystobacter fuscus DSM 2262]
MSLKDEARREYEELKSHFRSMNFEEFKGGGWFPKYVRWMLEEYSKGVDAEYIRRKYPGAGPVNQANKAIAIASKYSSLVGGASAAAVTGLELAVPTPGGPLAVAGVATSIMADIGLNTRLQLRTTYDLSVIHNAPLSLQDAEDCYLIFCNALGLKMSEVLGEFALSVGPKIIQYNVRKLLRGGFRKALVELIRRVAGTAIARKLTERAMLRLLVPGISIPISAGASYLFTKSMMKVANIQMQRRGSVIDPLIRLYRTDKSIPRELLIQGLIVVMEAPRREGWSEEQMNALRHTQNFLALNDEQIAALEGWWERGANEFAANLPPLSRPARAAFLQFLARAAALGDEAHEGQYVTALRAIATRWDHPFGSEDMDEARKAVG